MSAVPSFLDRVDARSGTHWEGADLVLTKLESHVDRLLRERFQMLGYLHDCLAYFEQRADVYDGDYGEAVPNEEAHLASNLGRLIRMVEAK